MGRFNQRIHIDKCIIIMEFNESRGDHPTPQNCNTKSPKVASFPKTDRLFEIRHLLWKQQQQHKQDCFLPKGSYAYPSSLIIFMKWNLYRKVPLCLSKQDVWTYKLRKVYCFKRLWLERNDWIGLHLFINDNARPSWHIFRRTSK